MCAKRIKFLMTRLSVCGLGVSCNEMNDNPMLLLVGVNCFPVDWPWVRMYITSQQEYC